MTTLAPRFADPIDAARFGEHRPTSPTFAFTGRLPVPAQEGRYHVYGARSCPASHRLAILRALGGLDDAVSMSWVDGVRDARGWAFREGTGADPVNGFTLLRQAYEATAPGWAGAATVPVLWDRETSTVVSNEPVGIGVDLLRAFGGSPLYPDALVGPIEEMGARIVAEVARVVGCAVYDPHSAERLAATLRRIDEHLATRRYLVGGVLTDADIRLWVSLVRYDAGPNAHGAVGRRLDAYSHTWAWAQRLYAVDAIRDTTDFASFAAPFADLPPWS